MSAMTIATVTAMLRSLLENGLVTRDVTTAIGGDVLVSAVPPDRIATGAEEKPQLNLFLYQVSASTGLRGPLGRADRLANVPPLVLELSYLITAYGAGDYQTDILLGYILQLFHETPLLKTEAIRSTIKAGSKAGGGRVVTPGLAALAGSDLAEQVDLRIVPQFLDQEALSRLWSAMQAKHRPSATYKVSVVPIGGTPGSP